MKYAWNLLYVQSAWVFNPNLSLLDVKFGVEIRSNASVREGNVQMGYALKAKAPDLRVYKVDKKAMRGDILEIEKSDKNIIFSVAVVCGHFERHLATVEKVINDLSKECANVANKPSIPNDFIDQVYDVFDDIEAYIDFLCEDFADFSETVNKARPNKTGFSRRTQTRLNMVTYLFETLEEKFQRQRIAVLSLLMESLTAEQLSERTA